MAKLISFSIDVTKIDKSRLIKGKKGTYLDCTAMIEDSENEYGQTVSVWHGQNQDERAAKAERIYLGNGKTLWDSGEAPKPTEAKEVEDSIDDLPF